MSTPITLTQAQDLYRAMLNKAKSTPGSSAEKSGQPLMNATEALNAFNNVKNEQPGLTDAVKAKLTSLSSDVFDKIDPLGVRDGFIDGAEFARFLTDDTNLTNGRTTRGADSLAKADTFANAGYTAVTNGKNNADMAGQNVLNDFEGLLGNTDGSVINGNLNKSDIEKSIRKWGDAGLDNKKAVATYMLENFDNIKNGAAGTTGGANGGADDVSAASLSKFLKGITEFWQ
jgi:hypothetical protein